MEDQEADVATRAEIAEEERRARLLRFLADTTAATLRQADLARGEAEALVAATRQRALVLFPGREGTFDLILAPRFARIIEERFGGRRAEVVPLAGRRPAS
jgi:hypothetical protein